MVYSAHCCDLCFLHLVSIVVEFLCASEFPPILLFSVDGFLTEKVREAEKPAKRNQILALMQT